MIRILRSAKPFLCMALTAAMLLTSVFLPMHVGAATSSSLPNISKATFTKYDINISKINRVWSLGNLVCTWDGKETRYYGPSGNLIKTFAGDTSSVYGILEDTYVKENEGEDTYLDTYINEGKYDAAKDGWSDFIWVENCIINIKTGLVIDDYVFEGIYGTSLFVETSDFIDGVAPIRVDGKYGVITDTGKIIVKPMYQSCFVISGGYSILENSEGKWAYVDRNGAMSDFKFVDIRDGGQSGLLIGSIEKTYLYDTSKAQEVLDLYEKVLINHGKEYSLCNNLPNCSVDLGNFSNGYAHAVIKYYYVSPTSFDLNVYTAFDGYLDQFGNKKIDFADHALEDSAILKEVVQWMGLDLDAISMPLSIDVSTKPEVDHSTYYKYGLMIANFQLMSASMENAYDVNDVSNISADYGRGYALYDKSGNKLMTFYSSKYKNVEVLDTDLVAAMTTDNILKLVSKTGATKRSITGCSRYEVERSQSGSAIVKIFQQLDSSAKETVGLYYEETGYYTGQYDGYPQKLSSGTDDYIFRMYDIDGYMVVSKKKVIIPKTECWEIRPTNQGYIVVKNTTKQSQYMLTFYNASGTKKNTVLCGPYYISSVAYGTTYDRYTDTSVILDGRYYDGVGNRLSKTTFFNQDNYINHGFALVQHKDGAKNLYGIMSSSGKMVTGYIFTSNSVMYRVRSDKIINKYGSLIVCYKNKIYRFHSNG